MFLDLRQLLTKHNLIKEVSNKSCDGTQNEDAEIYQEERFEVNVPSPTPSEVTKYLLEDQRDSAVTLVGKMQLRLQEARKKLEEWGKHYEKQYDLFVRWKSEGIIETTKTEFDVMLVQDAQDATRDYIDAEHGLDEAIQRARELGIELNNDEQESGFLDRVEDGHVESMDPAIYPPGVDRLRIERWMGEENEWLDHEGELDEWECRTVGVEDSISVVALQVATGKDRKRIDRWRSMCQVIEADIQAEDDGE